MLKIYNLKDKIKYINEVCILTQNEWGKSVKSKDEFDRKIKKKEKKIIDNLDNKSYCKLILLNDDKLVGFISIFPNDCDDFLNLTPWYATMYVKKRI